MTGVPTVQLQNGYTATYLKLPLLHAKITVNSRATRRRKRKKKHFLPAEESGCTHNELEVDTSQGEPVMQDKKALQINKEKTPDIMLTSSKLNHKNSVSNAESSESTQENCTGSSVRQIRRSTKLKSKMERKIAGARFRWINEQLYTTTGQRSQTNV